jgi:hypothetical protein
LEKDCFNLRDFKAINGWFRKPVWLVAIVAHRKEGDKR